MEPLSKVHQGVLLQIMWIVIIYLTGQIVWHYAIKRLEIQGG
jgi:ABC-type uncharacterized transport system permease subunit